MWTSILYSRGIDAFIKEIYINNKTCKAISWDIFNVVIFNRLYFSIALNKAYIFNILI
jgi:hypothetical protein